MWLSSSASISSKIFARVTSATVRMCSVPRRSRLDRFDLDGHVCREHLGHRFAHSQREQPW